MRGPDRAPAAAARRRRFRRARSAARRGPPAGGTSGACAEPRTDPHPTIESDQGSIGSFSSIFRGHHWIFVASFPEMNQSIVMEDASRKRSLMSELVYVGGQLRAAEDAAVSVFDHGLLYGDGIFEGIRAYNGRVFKLERHIERLFDSAKAIRLEMPLTRAAMADLVVDVCRRNGIVDGYIRLVVTRGRGDLSLDPRSCASAEVIVIARAAVTLYGRKRTTGVSVVTSTFRRNPPDSLSPAIKSLNYLNNVLARIEANDRGADEALLPDHNGYVAEATVDNFFIVTEQGLVAPPTATNLKGITRETILALAA